MGGTPRRGTAGAWRGWGARAGSVCRGPSSPSPVGTEDHGGPSPLSNGGDTRPHFTQRGGWDPECLSWQGPSFLLGVPGVGAGARVEGPRDAMRPGPGHWEAAPCSRQLSDGALPSSALISM